MLDFNTIEGRLQSALSIKRYIHTKGVVREAQKLAQKYGADVEKAKLAALLHDCAKCYPEDMTRRFCKEYHVEIDDCIKEQIDLAHGYLGAKVAKREYGIDDKEILDAIRYHTFGRKGMTLLDKIIYIADYIEPNRKDFDGLKEAREMAYIDIDKAVKLALEQTIEYNEKKGRIIHPMSLEALEDYK